MKKIFVLFENPDWMPPLERELKAARLNYEKINVFETSFDMSVAPPDGIFLNRMSPSSHTRGHTSSVDETREMIYWLESFGRRVVNGSSAFTFEVSKIKQYAALQAAGLKVPRTIAASGNADKLIVAAKSISAPFMVKHNRGGKGAGVQLFQTHEGFANYVSSSSFMQPMDHMTLIQEYIKPKQPHITRVEIVNGEFLYAINVSVEKGFELCPAEACEIGDAFCPTTDDGEQPTMNRQNLFSLNEGFNDPIIGQYISLMKKNQIDIAGIEFIEDEKGNKVTYDINCTTNYSPGVEEKNGLNGMAKIAAFLKTL